MLYQFQSSVWITYVQYYFQQWRHHRASWNVHKFPRLVSFWIRFAHFVSSRSLTAFPISDEVESGEIYCGGQPTCVAKIFTPEADTCHSDRLVPLTLQVFLSPLHQQHFPKSTPTVSVEVEIVAACHLCDLTSRNFKKSNLCVRFVVPATTSRSSWGMLQRSELLEDSSRRASRRRAEE